MDGASSGIRPVCRGATFSTAAPTALIVGTVLSLVNQLHVVLDGDATWATSVRVVVNYAVPYVVASVGFPSACRARRGVTVVDHCWLIGTM